MLSRTAFRSAYQLSSRRAATASTILRSSAVQTRSAASTSSSQVTSKDEAYSLLLAQRKLRPLAPHLSIYQPQLTWLLSSLHRITGVTLAGSVYLFGISYAVAPLFGLHMETATMVASLATLPIAAKILLKATLATPFAFHCINGVRHLNWDTARELHLKGVYRTGYAVIGLTSIATVYLSFFA
ncbi:hypothetical protein EDC01DRAFT_667524 [Geopyxis carbonaria]|nr:hypothetical protein EDC01DRAFT_667524 [Geopyxis carbonaria]